MCRSPLLAILLLAILGAAEAADPVAELVAGSRELLTADAEEATAIGDRLAPLARRLFLSEERVPGMERLGLEIHTVASGESPAAILRRYAMRNELMELLNPDYDDRRLGVGQELKVLDLRAVELTTVVDRERYRLAVLARIPGLAEPVLAAWMKVGLGTDDRRTPAGVAHVGVRVRHPEWTHPDTGEVIPADDPANVLGGYWIALDGEGFDSIGLHGYTGAPSEDWLGKAGSRGCLRLLQDDIAAMFALLPKGSPVVVE